MAVVINKETGLAEELSQEKAKEALAAESHKVPLLNREGDLVSAPANEAAEFLQEGYSHPTHEHLKGLLKTAKYGTGEQQLKTAAEGAAKTATFGLSTRIEQELGVPTEDITAREETNPKSHLAGELAGVLIPGPGLESAGMRVAKAALRGKELSFGAKAIGQAVQGAALQAGDEVHKMFLNDPHQSIGSAVTNIGLSGLMTGTLNAGISEGGKLLANTVKSSRIADKIMAAKDSVQAIVAKNPELASILGSMALGHGPIPGAVIGSLARLMGLKGSLNKKPLKKLVWQEENMSKDRVNALWKRWALGTVASAEGETTPEGVRSLWEYSKDVFTGNKNINQAINSMFNKAVSLEVPKTSTEGSDKLDDLVRSAELDPTRLSMGSLGLTYANHAVAGTEYMNRAVQYLSSIRPKVDKPAPLSPQQPTNRIEKERYNRALRIAEQPLGILKEVKNGSLTVEDLATMHGVHPELLDLLRSKAFNMMAEVTASETTIPYKTAMGLSLFLGQPLISSTLPQNIVANQAVWQPMPQQQPAQQKPVRSTTGAFKSLSKESATPGQARELNKQSRTK